MKLKKVLALMSDPYWQLLVCQAIFLELAALYLDIDLKRSLLFTQLACISIVVWVYWHTIKVRKRLKELEKRGGAT